MSETLQANLSLNLGDFTSALQSAQAQLTAFASQVASALNSATTAFTQQATAIQQSLQATQALATAATQAAQTQRTTTQVTQQATQTIQAQTSAMTQATSSTSAWTTALQVAAGVGLATTIRGIASELKNFVVESVNVASQMQNLRLAFAGVAGGALAGASALRTLRETADKAGIDFLSLAQGSRVFELNARNAGLTQEQTNRLLQQTAVYVRALGGDTTAVTRVLAVFGTELNRGNITTGELTRRLGTLLPGAMQLFQEATGKSREELLDLAKSSDLLANTTLVRLGEAMQHQVGDKAKEASELASSSFARFANNMRDISVTVGESILTILKPVLDTINKAFELSRQAAERARQATGRALGDQQGFPGATPNEIEEIQQIGRQLQLVQAKMANLSAGAPALPTYQQEQQQLRDELTLIQETIKKRQQLEDQLRAEGGITPPSADMVPFAEAAKTITKSLEDMRKELETIQAESKYFLSSDAVDKAKNELQAIDKTVKAISETIASKAGLLKYLPTDIGKQVADLDALRKKTQDLVETQKEQEKEALRLEKLTTPTKATQVQGDITALREAMRGPDLSIGQFNELAAKLDTLIKKRDELFGTDPLNSPMVLGLDAWAKAEKETANESEQVVKKIGDDARHVQEVIAALVAKDTKTQVDDQRVALAKMLDDLERHYALAGQLDEAKLAGALRIQRTITEEAQKELDKQARAYEQLARDIARPIASVFEQLLTGTGNILNTLKQMFIRFLSDLAAEAIAKQIVISFGAQILGSGSSASTGASGSFGQTITAAGTIASGASNTGSGVTGSLLSSAGLFKNILNTPLASVVGGGPNAGLQGPTQSGATLDATGGQTIGDTLGQAGAGIAVGSITNNFFYGKNKSGAEQTGELVGGVAGAAIGTAILPGLGTVIGGFLGALLGGFIGYLFTNKPSPEFQVTQAQNARVGYSERTGLQLTTPFSILDTRAKDVGAVGLNGPSPYGTEGGAFGEFKFGIEASINGLFRKTLADFQSAAPQIQQAIAGTLEAEFTKLTDEFTSVKFHGSNLLHFVQDQLTNILPTELARDLQPLTEAVQKINPIVLTFNQIVKQAQEDIIKLQQAALEQHLSLQTSIVGIQEGLFSPAQTFVARQGQLQQALGLLSSATPQQQTILIPQIQQLATQIFSLAQNKDVLGQDPQALRNLQKDLTGTLQGLQGTSGSAFTSLANTTLQQADIAQAQIKALLTTLPVTAGISTGGQDLSPNAVIINNALDQLQAIQQTLASTSPTAQQDATNQVQTALLTGQVASLQSIDSTEQQALSVLQNIAQTLIGAPGHAAGINYVPTTSLAWLHAGERVLTAQENASGGSGGDVHIHLNGTGQNTDVIVEKLISKIEQKVGRLGTGKILVRN